MLIATAPPVLDIPAAQRFLKVGRHSVLALFRRPDCPVVHLGRKQLVLTRRLVEYLGGEPGPEPEDRPLSIDEAAALVYRRRSWLYQQIQHGGFPVAQRLDRKVVLLSAALRWLREREQSPAAPASEAQLSRDRTGLEAEAQRLSSLREVA